MKLGFNAIPKNAQCVYSGIQFRIWQWPQVEFDGETKTYEMAERCPTVWAIAVADGKIVLNREVHANQPDIEFYSLPGGKGDFDEDPLLGAQRELSEETGYESSDWALFSKGVETGKIVWPTYVYIAKNARKVREQHLDGGERITSKLYTLEEFFKYVEREDFRGFIIQNMVAEMHKDTEKKANFIKTLGI